MNATGNPPVIAIIGAGEMGAAVGRRLRETGARVVISLAGRSAASAERVRRAGLEVLHDDHRLANGVDYILSIVPPAAAIEVAERLRCSKRCRIAAALRRLQCDFSRDDATNRAPARTPVRH
jgi:prephenate dehydrogenase